MGDSLLPYLKDFLKYIGGYKEANLIEGQYYEVLNVNYNVVGYYKVLVMEDSGITHWVPLNYFYFEDNEP